MSDVGATRGRGRGDLLRLLRLASPGRMKLFGAVLLATCASGAAVALLGVSAWLITRASFEPPVLHLMVAVTGVRFFGVSRGVFRYAERLVSHDSAFDSLRTARQRIYAKLERLAPAGGLWRRGDLLERLIADVSALADLVTRTIVPLFSTLLVFAAAVVTSTLILPSAGVVLVIVLLLACVVAPLLVLRGDRRDEAALRRVRADRAAVVSEAVLAAGDPGLRALSSQWDAEVARADADEQRLVARGARRAGASAAITMAAIATGVLVTWWLAADAVAAGQLSAETAAVAIMLPLGLLELAQGVQPALATAESVRASARRIFEVMDTPERGVPDAGQRVALPPVAECWPVRLEGASIRWPRATEPTIRGIDLRIDPGSRTVIVGESGSGKSTVLAALLGYAQVTDGSYTIGGVPHDAIDPGELRTLFAWCDQQAHLFDTTIEENVRLARPDATDDQIDSALARAQLADWIATLPSGKQTRVGQFGVLVSGGQRQRIALARALLADRPILLVDEPTAGLDRATGDVLMRDIHRSIGDRALVLVTHEPRDVEGFDRMLRLGAIEQRT